MNNNVINHIRIKRIDKELPIPVRAHTGDAGVDLYSTETCVIHPGERALIGTGIAIALPLGTVGLIHPRSGRALREGLGMVNAPGTIDAGYRGELKVCLINLDPRTPIQINRGERTTSGPKSGTLRLYRSRRIRRHASRRPGLRVHGN